MPLLELLLKADPLLVRATQLDPFCDAVNALGALARRFRLRLLFAQLAPYASSLPTVFPARLCLADGVVAVEACVADAHKSRSVVRERGVTAQRFDDGRERAPRVCTSAAPARVPRERCAGRTGSAGDKLEVANTPRDVRKLARKLRRILACTLELERSATDEEVCSIFVARRARSLSNNAVLLECVEECDAFEWTCWERGKRLRERRGGARGWPPDSARGVRRVSTPRLALSLAMAANHLA